MVFIDGVYYDDQILEQQHRAEEAKARVLRLALSALLIADLFAISFVELDWGRLWILLSVAISICTALIPQYDDFIFTLVTTLFCVGLLKVIFVA